MWMYYFLFCKSQEGLEVCSLGLKVCSLITVLLLKNIDKRLVQKWSSRLSFAEWEQNAFIVEPQVSGGSSRNRRTGVTM